MSAAQVQHWSDVKDFDDEREARFASRDMAIDLVESLKAKGFTCFEPPPKPSSTKEFVWDEFADCRIVIRYLINTDKFRLYVDVLASP